jgi:hypothetical protein
LTNLFIHKLCVCCTFITKHVSRKLVILRFFFLYFIFNISNMNIFSVVLYEIYDDDNKREFKTLFGEQLVCVLCLCMFNIKVEWHNFWGNKLISVQKKNKLVARHVSMDIIILSLLLGRVPKQSTYAGLDFLFLLFTLAMSS